MRGRDLRVMGGVEVRGYSALLSIPPVLVTTVGGMWLVLGEEGASGTRELRLFAMVAVVLAVPVFVALTYRLRLAYEPSAHVLTVTRRRWLGAGRSWRIGPEELVCWYYVESLQTLVVRRRGERSLRFVLWTGKQGPERVVAWAEWALGPFADPAAGAATSRRARRALMGGAFGVVFAVMAVIVVMFASL